MILSPYLIEVTERPSKGRKVYESISSLVQMAVYGFATGHTLFWLQVYFKTGALI